METYGLIGQSGTGKSHKAITLAYENDIAAVIDDGLLIKDGQRIAGASAKGEKTAIKAVKRAIFVDEAHSREVREALAGIRVEKVLVLGTSAKMVNRICETLALPQPIRYFTIDEVASPREIATARTLRKTYGMHVIPVPVVEVKEDLTGYLMRPIRYLMRRQSGQKQGERTIVQPRFSTMGKLVITNQALEEMVVFLAVGLPGVIKVSRVQVEVKKGSAKVRLEFTAKLIGYLPDTAEKIHRLLQDQIALLCGIYCESMHIVIRNCRV